MKATFLKLAPKPQNIDDELSLENMLDEDDQTLTAEEDAGREC